jgi:signal transduction histidine kinase/CheY-like chemotaxis protein
MADPGSHDRRDGLHVALDSISDAVVLTDLQGRVTFTNRAADRLTEIGAEAALGRPLSEILRLVDEDTCQPAVLLPPPAGGGSGEIPARHHLLLVDAAGTRHFDATVQTLAEAEPAEGVVVLRDVTEPARLEEELNRRAEEMAAADRRKDQFLAMLAHELRNPLAPIRNAVELMRQVETLDSTFQPAREMVERQVKHLARLVDDLLDVSRITSGSIRLRKEGVDLGAVVLRAVEASRPLIESRGHMLSVRLPAEPVRLEADPTRLEQVISNLLNNAAKYTMPGGQVEVAAAREGREGEEAVVRVRDTGIGVPPDVLDRVFEPFVQQSDGSLARTDGGLGVGLTLVRSLVEMHGGRVEASSPGLGQGSEFVVRLPAQAAAQGSIPSSADPPSPGESAGAPRSLRVLVVEDNVDAAESLATLLRLWNHDVSVVHDGRMAVEAAREQQPEVVLLDIGLPGLDGYQVARCLRDELHLDHALLVAMTGYGQPEDRRRSREAGIQYHFVKPVEPLLLRNLLSGAALPEGWEAGTPS